jgi:ectoine hydroxylase-related dioxygenase (phytanoyl-CoA dioxygenase family)
MSIAQREFARPLRNNTTGFDVWRAKLGLALGPMALDDVDWSTSLDVNLPAGDLICFSANHFHGTGLNPGRRPRVSFELRFASDEDRAAGRAAPNVDFGGVGELEGFRSVNVARI